MPVDRIRGVLEQVGAALVRQSVHRVTRLMSKVFMTSVIVALTPVARHFSAAADAKLKLRATIVPCV
jgi:hypothetical protein